MTSKNDSSSTHVYAALQMLEILRDKDKGCPWLSSRRFDELLPYFNEELHEYRQAVAETGLRSPEARQELADLVFQVLLHATLLKEESGVGFDDLCADVAKKLERRHPHVFDPQHVRYATAEEAGRAWEELKLKEAATASRTQETLETMSDKIERIPSTLPALQRASRIGEKTESFGFDWDSPEAVFEKVREEFVELERAGTESERREELGDLFFSLAQYARHLRFPPEEVADEANRKFLGRFRKMEQIALKKGLEWKSLGLAEKEALWKEAKRS
ncbi:MAG: nucleoside triphosphate pyrophosphohydrolase [Bdellovibrionota bacterium]